MKLYTAIGANCSERVEWVINYKKINAEIIDYKSLLSEEYKKINCFNKVPALEHDGFIITESMAICEYLEELAPSEELLGKTPKERAKIRELCEIINTTIHVPQSSSVGMFYLSKPKDELKEYRETWLFQKLTQVSESYLGENQFTIGDHFSLADIFLICIYKKLLSLNSEKRIKNIDYIFEKVLKDEKAKDSMPFESIVSFSI